MVAAVREWRSRVKRNRGNDKERAVVHVKEAVELEAVGQEAGKTEAVVEKEIA